MTEQKPTAFQVNAAEWQATQDLDLPYAEEPIAPAHQRKLDKAMQAILADTTQLKNAERGYRRFLKGHAESARNGKQPSKRSR